MQDFDIIQFLSQSTGIDQPVGFWVLIGAILILSSAGNVLEWLSGKRAKKQTKESLDSMDVRIRDHRKTVSERLDANSDRFQNHGEQLASLCRRVSNLEAQRASSAQVVPSTKGTPVPAPLTAVQEFLIKARGGTTREFTVHDVVDMEIGEVIGTCYKGDGWCINLPMSLSDKNVNDLEAAIEDEFLSGSLEDLGTNIDSLDIAKVILANGVKTAEGSMDTTSDDWFLG